MRRAALVCLFLLLAACGGDTDSGSGPATDSAPPVPPATEGSVETEPVPTEPPETDPPETEPAPALAPFEPLGPGPYGVGVTTVTITDEDRDRPLTVDLWFPVDEGAEGAHLHVWRGNEPAWNLYHRALGFRPKYSWVTLEKRAG